MSVLEAVDRDLKRLALDAPDLADSALAAMAREMASQLDAASNSATSKSMCARVLSEVMAEIREAAPPKREADQVDDIAIAREARRSRSAGGAGA